MLSAYVYFPCCGILYHALVLLWFCWGFTRGINWIHSDSVLNWFKPAWVIPARRQGETGGRPSWPFSIKYLKVWAPRDTRPAQLGCFLNADSWAHPRLLLRGSVGVDPWNLLFLNNHLEIFLIKMDIWRSLIIDMWSSYLDVLWFGFPDLTNSIKL